MLAGARGRGRRALRRRWRCSRGRDPDDGLRPEARGRARRRLHGRRHGEGRRDDPPAPRDDARRDHDRLPARRGRGRGVPAARRRAQLQPDLGRRRLLHERRRRPARQRRERRRPRRRGLRRSARPGLCAISHGRSSPTARARRSCSRSASTGAASDAEAEAIARRIATSPLVKTAAFGHDPNWGRVLMAAGSAPYGDGFAQLDTDRLTVAFDGVAVFADGVADRRRAGARRRGLPDRPRARARRRRGRLPRLRPHLRLRPDQRGVHDVSRIVLKLGGRVAAAAAARGARAAGSRDTTSSSSTAPARRSRPRWSGAGSHPTFVDGRRVTTPEVLEVVRASLAAVNAEVCAAIGPTRSPLFGDAIGLRATQVEALGLVGDPMPSAPAAVVEALAAGRDPRGRAARAAGEAAAQRQRRRGRSRACGRARRRADPVRQRRPRRADGRRGDRAHRAPTTPTGCSATAPSRAASSRSSRRPSWRARGGVRGRDRRHGGGRVTRARSSARASRDDGASDLRAGRPHDRARRGLPRLGRRRAARTSTSSPGSRSSGSATARRRRSRPPTSSSTASGTRRTSTGRSRCCGSPALLAERLRRRQAFFCNSGAEANEAALKIARKATGRTRIVALEGGFHGRTLGRALGDRPAGEVGGLRPARPRRRVRPAERRRVARGGARAGRRHGAAAARARARRGRRDPARAGIRAGRRRARARGRGAALRRRGAGRAWAGRGRSSPTSSSGSQPDLVTLAKGLANGLPIGALLAGERAAPGFVPGDHGSTFGGNPVAAAAACAVVEAIDDELLAHVARARRRARRRPRGAPGRAHGPRARAAARRASSTGRSARSSTPAASEGLLVLSAGPDVLRLTPPLVVSAGRGRRGARHRSAERACSVNRRERQSAILRLVRDRALSTQAELVQALRDEGHDVVQTTVSRDVTELGLVKVRAPSGRLIYAAPGHGRCRPAPRDRRRDAALRDRRRGGERRRSSSSRRPPATRARSPRRSTRAAIRRSRARSPATTRSSSPPRTGRTRARARRPSSPSVPRRRSHAG